MNRLVYFVVALFIGFTSLSYANQIDTSCPQHVIWGAPQIKQEGNNQYLCRTGYAVNLNYQTKIAYFVTEVVKPELLVNKQVSRRDDFREDKDIPIQYRVTLKDYQGSGLDRGHMAPAADFTYDANIMSESFLLSNMMPQSPGNNRGIWKYLEEMTRYWASQYGHLYIITGTHYEQGHPVIGNGVAVPTYVYKIIIDPKNTRAIAFMFPNMKLNPKTMEQYIVSISEIEALTGINFSPAIPVHLQGIEKVRAIFQEW